MAVPLEQFVKHLEDSGILAGDTLQEFLPPRNTPKDAQELARQLILQKKLTKFQAEAVIQGNGKSLVLDNYVLLEKIGEGGMGQVFKAKHRRIHRIVAVKVLPNSMMKNAATVARFQREVQAAARISHPTSSPPSTPDRTGGSISSSWNMSREVIFPRWSKGTDRFRSSRP
jgi:serine/threonine-protein kinase